MNINVVDFFSGCGGTSSGLSDLGFKIIGAIDNDKDAAQTYRSNFPQATFFEKDIRELTEEEVATILPPRGQVLFAGCAPCQPFSKQRHQRKEVDSRRELLLEFLRFIIALKPDHILVENVPGIQEFDRNTGPFSIFVETLKQMGYSVDHQVVRSADYGVPQLRRRLILVASRIMHVSVPKGTHDGVTRSYSTVRDWISSQRPIKAGESDPNDPDHTSAKLSPLNLKRIQNTPEGGGRANWPNELKVNCHKDYTGHSDVYGRLSWDKPASALTTRCISYSNGRFGHPEQDRAISLREAALLQTFSPKFQFSGPLTSRAKQVGNAVPPLMAKAIGKAFIAS